MTGNPAQYLRGRSMPRLRYLDALVVSLGVERSKLVGDFDTPAPQDRSRSEPGARDVTGTVRLADHGDEVQLWIEQRVPWTVARANYPCSRLRTNTPIMDSDSENLLLNG